MKIIIWLFPIITTLHEIEEWNILKWYKKYYINIPESTNLSIRIWIIIFSLFSFVLTGVCFLLNNLIGYYLMSIFILFMICNGIQHIYWTIYFKSYAPGLIFSSTGIIIGIFIALKGINENVLNLWIILMIFLILFFKIFIETIKKKNEMTKEIKNVHLLGIKLEKMFFKKRDLNNE